MIPKRHSVRQRLLFSTQSFLSRSDRRYVYLSRYSPWIAPVFDTICSFCTFHSKYFTCYIDGEIPFLPLCHALVVHHTESNLLHCISLARHLRGVKISALYAQRFRWQTASIDIIAWWWTYRQKDRETSAKKS